MKAHETALVDSAAQIDDDVEIGAYSIIGPKVHIGTGTRIGPHVVVTGNTTIGRNNRFYQFSSIGEVPQDKKFAGEDTRLEIGDDNTVRDPLDRTTDPRCFREGGARERAAHRRQ